MRRSLRRDEHVVIAGHNFHRELRPDKAQIREKTAASRLAALNAFEHACECIFAVTPVTRAYYAARDEGPLHAEASGHPKVGSAESWFNERLSDSSAPLWKVTSS